MAKSMGLPLVFLPSENWRKKIHDVIQPKTLRRNDKMRKTIGEKIRFDVQQLWELRNEIVQRAQIGLILFNSVQREQHLRNKNAFWIQNRIK